MSIFCKISLHILIFFKLLSCGNREKSDYSTFSSRGFERFEVKDSNPITKVRIEDFNWESGATKVLIISEDKVVSGEKDNNNSFVEYELNKSESERVKNLMESISVIKAGHYYIEGLVDGTNLKFAFTLSNGVEKTTTLNNVNFNSYDQLANFAEGLISDYLNE